MVSQKGRQMDLERVFSIAEVARALKVDDRTIRKLLDCEAISQEHWFYVGRQIRIKQTAVELLMNNET